MEAFSVNQPNLETRTSDPVEDFARLYDAEMPRVYRYIRYHVGTVEEAEDLTADVFHRALRHWPRMRQQLSSPRAWLLAVASNRLTDHFRQKHIQPAFSLAKQEVASVQAGPEETAVRQEEVSTLLARLAELPERDRTVLALRFAGDLSHREIGQVLGISEAASAVALLRALRRLRESYQGDGQ